MEAIKEIYRCPLCSHGTLTPETHSCHRQFILGVTNLKDNKPKLSDWEEYRATKHYRKRTAENCLNCGMFCSKRNDNLCSDNCRSIYLTGGDK